MTAERRCTACRGVYGSAMKLMRTAALAGIAKKLYDESRKPHNQAKIQKAVQSLKDRRGGGTTRPR